MDITNVNKTVKVTNLDELNKLLAEAKLLADQLKEKQEQIAQWQPKINFFVGKANDEHDPNEDCRIIMEGLESTRKYLCALELFSLHHTDRVLLVEAGLLDGETLMPTNQAHAFIDNTRNKERWEKTKSTAHSIKEAVHLADQYAREDLGIS